MEIVCAVRLRIGRTKTGRNTHAHMRAHISIQLIMCVRECTAQQRRCPEVELATHTAHKRVPAGRCRRRRPTLVVVVHRLAVDGTSETRRTASSSVLTISLSRGVLCRSQPGQWEPSEIMCVASRRGCIASMRLHTHGTYCSPRIVRAAVGPAGTRKGDWPADDADS